MKKKIIYLFSLFLISLISCNTTEPPPPPREDNRKLTLTFEDASCIEAWIQLETINLQLPADLNLITTDAGGNPRSKILNLKAKDSLLYIDSLLPNKSYKIKVSSIENPISSNELTVTTMDTTSHNFTFETWTFGDVGSSILYDCAIISEDNIWCVGDIKIADTSENGYTIYNAVHWDGNDWNLHRIMFKTICGQQSSQNAYPASSIIAFSENEIWVAQKGDQIAKIENSIQTQTICMPWTFSINKIWGTSSNNLYVVGNNGNIAHYQNGQWNKIESGTDIPLADIYSNNQNEIFISGADNLNFKGIILKNEGVNSFRTLITGEIVTENELFSKLYGSLSSVWVDEKNNLYTGGNIIFQYRHNKWDYVRSMPENFIGGNPNVYYRGFIASIRGNSSNDYWVVGDRNTVRHFNGVSWKQIGLPYDPMSYRIWRSLSVKNNLCVIVGDNINTASVMIIKK